MSSYKIDTALSNHKSQLLTGTLLCASSALALFLFTLAPTVQGFDSAELTMGAYDLGFVHPSGYPLYLLVGNLFSRLPFGNVGLRLNLMSAVFASLASGLLFRLIFQQTDHFLASVTATFLCFTAPTYWSQAIRAEVYSLHIFLMVAALYAWRLAQQADDRRLYMLCFALLGLGIANHLTAGLLWAAVLLSAIWLPPKLRRVTLPAAALGLVIASLVYLYFPLRSQAALRIDYIRPYFQVDPGSPAGLWWMFSGQAFRCLFLPQSSATSLLGGISNLFSLIWEETLGFGLLLGVWGWIALHKSEPRWNWLLSFYFVANLVMFLAYNAIDKEVMFIPIYILIAIWAATGIGALANWSAGKLGTTSPRRVNLALNGLLLALVLTGVALDWPATSLRDDRRAYDFAQEILDQVGPSTTIVSHWATASVFDYLLIVEGQRPDVESINVDFYFLGIQTACQPVTNQRLVESGWIARLAELSGQDRLCFIEPLHGLPQGYTWQDDGPCWQLSRQEDH